jgi:hypothetical protein
MSKHSKEKQRVVTTAGEMVDASPAEINPEVMEVIDAKEKEELEDQSPMRSATVAVFYDNDGEHVRVFCSLDADLDAGPTAAPLRQLLSSIVGLLALADSPTEAEKSSYSFDLVRVRHPAHSTTAVKVDAPTLKVEALVKMTNIAEQEVTPSEM